MAGQMNPQNQRQSQKNRNRSGMKYKAVRSHTISLACPKCHASKDVPSQEAYHKGGTVCSKCRIPAVYAEGRLYSLAIETRMQHKVRPVKREVIVKK